MYSSLIEKLRYNSEDGNLYWAVDACTNVSAGDLAGYVDRHGYRIIRFKYKGYKAHRIIWYLHNKSFELFGPIDHINGIRSDNRIDNLRLVTERDNSNNKKAHRDGALYGCHKISKKQESRWRATIVVDKEKHSLGCYATEEEAHLAYLIAAEFFGVTLCI